LLDLLLLLTEVLLREFVVGLLASVRKCLDFLLARELVLDKRRPVASFSVQLRRGTCLDLSDLVLEPLQTLYFFDLSLKFNLLLLLKGAHVLCIGVVEFLE
jgi:hypothetical protein